MRIAVEMVVSRRRTLDSGQVHGARADAIRQELAALTWLLERAGFPPSRYDEVLADAAKTPVCYSGVLLVEPPLLFWQRYRPADPNSPIVVGDIVVSTHDRHKGRMYRITAVAGPVNDPANQALCGQRVSRMTGQAERASWPIRHSVMKMELAPDEPDAEPVEES